MSEPEYWVEREYVCPECGATCTVVENAPTLSPPPFTIGCNECQQSCVIRNEVPYYPSDHARWSPPTTGVPRA